MFDKIIESLNGIDEELELKDIEYQYQRESIEKDLRKIVNLLQDLNIDKEDIRLLDCSEEIEILSRLDSGMDVSELKEKLRIISRILNGKYDNKFDWNLSDEQSKNLDDFIKLLEEARKTLIERRKIVFTAHKGVNKSLEGVYNLELLIEYLDDEVLPISKKDFLEYIHVIIDNPNVSYSLKRELLLAVSQGNKEIEMNSTRTPIDIEELKRMLIAEYDFSSEEISLIDQNREVVLQRANITKIREILNFMVEKRIYDKFQKDRLLPILLYGNLGFIKERYRKLAEDGNLHNAIFYDTPSVWIVNANNKQRAGRKPKSEARPLPIKQSAMYVIAHETSYEQMMKNVEFLKQIGFEPTFKDYGYTSVLTAPNSTLRNNFDICQCYNLLDNKGRVKIVSLLKCCGLEEAIDRFIELGLKDYAFGFPSRLAYNDEKLFAALYKTKRDNPPRFYEDLVSYDYQEKIYSPKFEGRLRSELTNGYLNYNIRDIDNFYAENGRIYPTVPNQEEFDQIVEDSEGVSISEGILEDENIRKIEANNKVNDYMYRFGNQIISRLKVLRIYSLFLGNPEINLDDAFMYSIIHNSMLDEEAYKAIKEAIGYGEKEHELS